jgi:hypothetical protein
MVDIFKQYLNEEGGIVDCGSELILLIAGIKGAMAEAPNNFKLFLRLIISFGMAEDNLIR